jgi:hypothetical protein
MTIEVWFAFVRRSAILIYRAWSQAATSIVHGNAVLATQAVSRHGAAVFFVRFADAVFAGVSNRPVGLVGLPAGEGALRVINTLDIGVVQAETFRFARHNVANLPGVRAVRVLAAALTRVTHTLVGLAKEADITVPV